MIVMIMMEEVAKSVILFHAQVFKFLAFTNALIRATRLKLAKRTINNEIFQLGSSKTRKME